MHLIATEGPLRGLVINLDDGEEKIVGRDPDLADVILEDTAVSRQHAHLTKTQDGVILTNLSTTNPLLINDLPLLDTHLLKEGDKVQIGNSVFLYSDEKAPELPPGHEEIEPTPLDLEDTSYDTIFQETKEEEIPFHLIGASGLILKVLTGPNAGAEIPLDTSKAYLIGKDPTTCDILFNDMSVSKEHAKLSIDENRQLFLEDLHSKNGTLVNHKPLKEKTALTPQDIIAFGTTTCIVVDREAASETIYSPVTFTEEEKKESKEEEKEEVWKKEKIPTSLLVGGGVAFFVLLVLFLSFFGLLRGDKLKEPKINYVEQIADIVKNYDSVEFSYNPNGETLFLVGHVIRSIDLQELLYDLNQLSYVKNIQNNLVIDETVWKNMNDILTENTDWRSVNLSSSSPGKFILKGYVKSPKDAEALSDYMNANFNFLSKLTNEVYIDQILQAEVNSLLLGKRMDGITFQLTGGELILGGLYSEKQLKEFTEAKEMLGQVLGIRSIKDLAVLSSESMARIDLSSKYQISGYASRGHENFSVVINGQIFTLGDLMDGMELTAIASDEVLLERDGIKYKIHYTRSR